MHKSKIYAIETYGIRTPEHELVKGVIYDMENGKEKKTYFVNKDGKLKKKTQYIGSRNKRSKTHTKYKKGKGRK